MAILDRVNPNKQMIICDTPEAINAYQMLATRSALKLEIIGLRHSRGSVAKLVRNLIGSKTRDKQVLLAQFEQVLRNEGILRSEPGQAYQPNR